MNSYHKCFNVLGIGDRDQVQGYAKSLANFVIHVDNVAPQWYEKIIENKLKGATTKYDLILLCGGADINPEIYGDPNPFVFPDGSTGPAIWFSDKRDALESMVIKEYIGKIPIIGVCRGLQILWAMTGGKLIHDLKPAHPGGHPVHLHNDWRIINARKESTRVIGVNSMHHQGLDLARGMADGWDIIATAHDGLPEAAINMDKRCGGVQYHPEGLHPESPGRILWDKMVCKLLNIKEK